MITDEDIRAAKLAVSKAQSDLGAINNGPARLTEDQAARAWELEHRKVESAKARLASLEARQATERQQTAARRKIEKDAKAQLEQISADLADSRVELLEATLAAEEALAAVLTAAVKHDQRVGRSRNELLALGLAQSGEDLDEETTAGGGRAGLRVHGVWWHPVDPANVLARVVHNVALANLGQRHGVTQWLVNTVRGGRMAVMRMDELLSKTGPRRQKSTTGAL